MKTKYFWKNYVKMLLFCFNISSEASTLQKLLADVCPTQIRRDRKYKNWNGMVWLEDVEILKFK